MAALEPISKQENTGWRGGRNCPQPHAPDRTGVDAFGMGFHDTVLFRWPGSQLVDMVGEKQRLCGDLGWGWGVGKIGKRLQGQMKLSPYCLKSSWHGHSFLTVRAGSLIHDPMIKPGAWNTLSILCVHTHAHACRHILLTYPTSAYTWAC